MILSECEEHGPDKIWVAANKWMSFAIAAGEIRGASVVIGKLEMRALFSRWIMGGVESLNSLSSVQFGAEELARLVFVDGRSQQLSGAHKGEFWIGRRRREKLGKP